MPDAIFERRGDLFQPTEAAVGPWDPGALHGSPVAMLVARQVEAVAADEPMDVVRLTLELLRPVPLAPLAVSVDVERPGKRVQLIGATITSDGVEVARARALRIRRADLNVATPPEPPPPGPADLSAWEAWSTHPAYHLLGVDLRFAAGKFLEPGPATMWVRLRLPVIGGEEPTPLQRAAAAADYGNGISGVLSPLEWIYINPDLTMYLARQPEGEWVCLSAKTDLGPGHGLAHSTLYDARGEIGRALQGLFVQSR
ncbi:MAG TPA: thioesterase family protein [Candidatus Dormibacteraeota bacterium]